MGSLEEVLYIAKKEAKRKFKNSMFDMCSNMWILLHAILYLTPYHTKEMGSVVDIIDEEYRYCVYH
jgi:hypothetical protein